MRRLEISRNVSNGKPSCNARSLGTDVNLAIEEVIEETLVSKDIVVHPSK